MKISHKRKAISQSLDLFIIVGAVLAVGGVVTASVYGLINGNSQSTAIQITSISAQGAASSASGGVNSFSITVKDVGSASISGTLIVTLTGTSGKSTVTAPPSPSAAATQGSSVSGATYATYTAPGTAVTLTATVSLQPGGQVAISAGSIGAASNTASTGLTTGWNTGVVQSVSVTLGVASATTTVTS